MFMKKTIFLILIVFLFNTTYIYASEEESHVLTLGGNDWISLYYDHIVSDDTYFKDGFVTFDNLALLDLDLDGTPELIGGTVSDMECYTTIALTIKDGKVVKLKDNTKGLCGISFNNGKLVETVGVEAYLYADLYQDKNTKALKWIGKNQFSNGINPRITETYQLGLKDNSLVAHNIELSETDYNNLQLVDSSYLLNPLNQIESDAILGFLNGYIPNFALAHSTIQEFTVEGRTIPVPLYTINSAPYVSLRDIAMLLKDTPATFSINFQKPNTILLDNNQAYKPTGNELKPNKKDSCYAYISPQKVFYKEELDISRGLYLIDGNNYIYPGDIPYSLGFSIDQDNVVGILKNN